MSHFDWPISKGTPKKNKLWKLPNIEILMWRCSKQPFCHSLNWHYLHYVILFSFGLYIYIYIFIYKRGHLIIKWLWHTSCPRRIVASIWLVLNKCLLVRSWVGFHGRELILEESFLGVHLVSFSYLRYWLHIVGGFVIYFLWIEHCSSKLGDSYLKENVLISSWKVAYWGGPCHLAGS